MDGYQEGDGWQDDWNRWWGLSCILVTMSTGWCVEMLNHYSVRLKLVLHCINYTGIKTKDSYLNWRIWNRMYCGDYKDEETKFLTSVLHSRYKPVSGFRELSLLGEMPRFPLNSLIKNYVNIMKALHSSFSFSYCGMYYIFYCFGGQCSRKENFYCQNFFSRPYSVL